MSDFTIQPKEIYQVHRDIPLASEGAESLTILYQPIIGADAVALYFILNGDSSLSTPSEYTHLDLFNLIGFGVSRFVDARARLEAIGLLSVYRKVTDAFGAVYGYTLREPLHPRSFFNDTTYSFLLKSMIGERRFQELSERYVPQKKSWDGYEDITQKFSDVYQFDANQFSNDYLKLENLSVQFESENSELTNFEDDSLDWAFLLFHADKNQINQANFTNAFKEKILLYHQWYGYDEMELVRFMQEVVHLSDGMVNDKELDKLILSHRSKQQSRLTTKVVSDSDQNQTKRFNTLLQTGFSQIDIQVIKESELFAPLDYLQAIKKQKNSYTSKLEEWIVKELVEKSPLRNSVINVLLNYVLVVKNNSTLPQKLVDKLAADWSEKKIGLPEDAIRMVRKIEKDSQEAKLTRLNTQKNFTNKNVRQEVVPKWLQEEQYKQKKFAAEKNVETQEKLTPEMEKRFNEYLRRKEGES